MAVSLSMPQFGQSVVEGTVSAWLYAEGDTVVRDDALLTISTDKIDTDLPAPISGTLLRICVEAGQTVATGTILAYVGEPGEELPTESEIPPIPEVSSPEPTETLAQRPNRDVPDRMAPTGPGFLSPVVARMAQEHGVDLSQITGTGRNGRITKRDLLTFLQQAADTQAMPAPVQDTEDRILHPLTPMRRAIAEHMTRSVHTSPHVTTFFEIDMANVVLHRESHKETWHQQGQHLTFMPYIMQAVVLGLQQVPQVNATFAAEGITTYRHIHLGVAVAVPDGLVVPVIRHAESLDLLGLGRSLDDLTCRATDRKLTHADLAGGTFAVTNHGVSGSMAGTPIIHQPQAAILGVGSIVKRPVVRGSSSLLPSADDAIVIRPMCVFSLSFDHRVLDGATADRFMSHVRDTLQSW